MRYILLFALLISAIGLAGSTDKVILSELSISENAYPGDSVKVSFRIRNINDWSLEDINIQVIGGYPLLRTSPRNISHIDKIAAHRSSELISTLLEIEPDAISGDHGFFVDVSFITFAYATEMQTYTTRIPVTMHILGVPWLVADVISSTPPEISGGDAAEVQIRVWNNGSGKAKDVWLYLRDTREIDIAFPFEANYLGEIKSKESKDITVSLKLGENSSPILHDLPASFENSDEYGNKHSKEFSLGIESKKQADFEIECLLKDKLSPDSKDNFIEVKVRNTGNKKAESIRLSFISRYPFFASGKTAYLGELDSNGSRTVGFHVDVDENAAAQDYPVDVQIEWKDDESEESALERFSLGVSERSRISESFYERLVVKKDTRLWLGILGILVFFSILFRISRTR